MSSIGKVFVILNALLAAAFLGYAVHSLGKAKEWTDAKQKQVAELQVAKEQAEKQVSDLTAKLGTETSAKEAARAEANQNKETADRNARDLDAKKAEADKLTAELSKISESLNGFNTTNKDLIAAKDKAAADLMEAEKVRDTSTHDKDAADKARRDAEDALRQAQAKISDLEAQMTAANKTVADLNTKLSTVVAVTGVDLSKIAAQPQVDGAVLGVNMEIKPGLVTLNVGSDAQVSSGMTFEIYRGGTYKGQVRVQKVLANTCSALITRLAQGQTITQGDSASTRL
jgi:hypothetical protein